MTEAEFEAVYRQALLAIEDTLETLIESDEIDLDYETINDILSVEFEDGSALIITKQTATQQLWVAAVSGGFHFILAAREEEEGEKEEKGKVWQSTLDQQSLADKLSQVCQLQAGAEIDFSAI